MLEDLCNLQHETLKKRDAYAKVLCNKINELTDDYAELEKAAKKLTKNYLTKPSKRFLDSFKE